MRNFISMDGVRATQAMVAMRDGTRLNTFVYLPETGGPDYPVILQRTPYGITRPGCEELTDFTQGWLPDPAEPMRGSILRGYRAIVERGYAAVYQDTRGRFASEGEDQVYATDAHDGADTLAWLAIQPWCNRRVGLSGSSAGATTALAAAASGHPCAKAFFAQVGGSSIYDDVVYEGNGIEMERLWLWVAKNVPGLSASHREFAARRAGLTMSQFDAAVKEVEACYERLERACSEEPPFVGSEDWLGLPLLGHPSFAICQPFLDEILSHPAPDAFRAAHGFRRHIDIPGFHATTWYDIFQTSVIAAYQDIARRVANQRLWIGPNDHYFIYREHFWPRDPYFEWFDHWLKHEHTAIVDEPPVYFSPDAWVDPDDRSQAAHWRHSRTWPPPGTTSQRLHLRGDLTLSEDGSGGPARHFDYDPAQPIPTRGGRNMLIAPGPLDQRPNDALPGYGLVYTGARLSSDRVLAGPVTVHLHVGSDCPDTDFVARLVELRKDGTARLLMDGVTRAMLREPQRGTQPLAPEEVVALRITLGHISHTVSAGSRLRLDIGSSNFPRRARNTNSGNLLLAADGPDAIRIARNTVHHDPGAPSWLELTVRHRR